MPTTRVTCDSSGTRMKNDQYEDLVKMSKSFRIPPVLPLERCCMILPIEGPGTDARYLVMHGVCTIMAKNAHETTFSKDFPGRGVGRVCSHAMMGGCNEMRIRHGIRRKMSRRGAGRSRGRRARGAAKMRVSRQDRVLQMWKTGDARMRHNVSVRVWGSVVRHVFP